MGADPLGFPDMASLLDLLLTIRQDPLGTLRFHSAEKLNGFIFGWAAACGPFSCPGADPTFRKIYHWLAGRHGFGDNYSFGTLVQLLAGNDRDAFDLYFEELENYREYDPGFFETEETVEHPSWSREEMMRRIRAKPDFSMGVTTLPRVTGFLAGDAYARTGEFSDESLRPSVRRVEVELNKLLGGSTFIPCETLLLFPHFDHNSAVKKLWEYLDADAAGTLGKYD